MQTKEKNYFPPSLKATEGQIKFSLALVLCLLVRLIPFRAPNIEPIMATTMPFSKAYGALTGFSFAVLSILLYDLATHTLGVQTLFTAGAYGAVALAAAYYFQKKQGSVSDYVKFAIIGTLFFDALTGLTVGPLFFHESFMGALVGQIPFTLLHLLGNIALAAILSPAIYKILIRKKERAGPVAINIFNPKII
jgi:hypothetical protein